MTSMSHPTRRRNWNCEQQRPPLLSDETVQVLAAGFA
jgi:hypothetical protein